MSRDVEAELAELASMGITLDPLSERAFRDAVAAAPDAKPAKAPASKSTVKRVAAQKKSPRTRR
jgi:hypothetical protein